MSGKISNEAIDIYHEKKIAKNKPNSTDVMVSAIIAIYVPVKARTFETSSDNILEMIPGALLFLSNQEICL